MKIAVLMSGGIDSSFAAFYLKKKGYNIIGLTFSQLEEKYQREELLRIKKIAKILSIPHFVFNIENIFKKEIIYPFLKSFRDGKTPNPCSFCNKKIKFGLLQKEAKKLGAEKIATGHYINIRKENSVCQLLEARDKNKDQSYFLWRLTQKNLSKLIFPLGKFTKEEILQKINKSPLGKVFLKGKTYKESSDICFLKGRKLSEFLKEELKKTPGPILNQKREEIGKHQGIQFFTVGQRAGIKIGAKSPKQKPFYVIEILKRKNAIVVGEKKELQKKEILAGNINWVSGKKPILPIKVKVKIRYCRKLSVATVYHFKPSICCLKFDVSQLAPASGQDVVFYKKNLLLGGGVIV